MTNLIRCRGALAEIAQLYSAQPDGNLHWHGHIWPGETALVVTQDGAGRRLSAMSWALPESCYFSPLPPSRRSSFFAREMIPAGGSIVNPDYLTRCLIVMEACAYPNRSGERVTRSWAGLWDTPLAAWAGLCSLEGGGCTGLLLPANELIARVSRNMPMLLPPEEQEAWLAGESPLSMERAYQPDDWYLEPSDEMWSSGEVANDG